MSPDRKITTSGHTGPRDRLFIASGLTDVWVAIGEEMSTPGDVPLPTDQWRGFHSARKRFLTLLAQQTSERRSRAAAGEF